MRDDVDRIVDSIIDDERELRFGDRLIGRDGIGRDRVVDFGSLLKGNGTESFLFRGTIDFVFTTEREGNRAIG